RPRRARAPGRPRHAARRPRPGQGDGAMNESGASEAREIVVVGVDGSAGARAALRWAIAEARLRGARLRAVHAWAPDYGAGHLGGGYASWPAATAFWAP